MFGPFRLSLWEGRLRPKDDTRRLDCGQSSFLQPVGDQFDPHTDSDFRFLHDSARSVVCSLYVELPAL